MTIEKFALLAGDGDYAQFAVSEIEKLHDLRKDHDFLVKDLSTPNREYSLSDIDSLIVELKSEGVRVVIPVGHIIDQFNSRGKADFSTRAQAGSSDNENTYFGARQIADEAFDQLKNENFDVRAVHQILPDLVVEGPKIIGPKNNVPGWISEVLKDNSAGRAAPAYAAHYVNEHGIVESLLFSGESFLSRKVKDDVRRGDCVLVKEHYGEGKWNALYYPVIGVDSIEFALKNQLLGIVVRNGGAVIYNLQQVREIADAQGIFVQIL